MKTQPYVNVGVKYKNSPDSGSDVKATAVRADVGQVEEEVGKLANQVDLLERRIHGLAAKMTPYIDQNKEAGSEEDLKDVMVVQRAEEIRVHRRRLEKLNEFVENLFEAYEP